MTTNYLDVGRSPNEIVSVTLDSKTYDIYFRWTERDESWNMAIALSGKKPFYKTKVLAKCDLLKNCRYKKESPQGEMYILDVVHGVGRPIMEETGHNKRFTLAYIN